MNICLARENQLELLAGSICYVVYDILDCGMRLLEAQTTIRLDGQLERHRGKRRIKPTTPTVLSDNATIQADVNVACLDISLLLLPF